MTKEQALSKTKSKFTNLMDGKVLSNVSVSTIINYYESLLVGQKPTPSMSPSNIESNFIEAEVFYLEWDNSDDQGL
jgi:hypothetical protein